VDREPSKWNPSISATLFADLELKKGTRINFGKDSRPLPPRGETGSSGYTLD